MSENELMNNLVDKSCLIRSSLGKIRVFAQSALTTIMYMINVQDDYMSQFGQRKNIKLFLNYLKYSLQSY